MNQSPSLNTSRWKLSEDIHGPVIAFFVSLEFLLSLPSNIFIIAYSFCHGKESLKKSATILLFCLALGNLFMTLFYMPFVIVASSAGEWIFGGTDHSREIVCQIHSYIHMCANTVSVFTLAAVSFDRFLNIVKASIYSKIMTWKFAIGIITIIWILAILLNLAPYYGTGLGEYFWSRAVGGCTPSFIGQEDYVIILSLLSLIPLSIIIVTSVWTFMFTRGFLRRTMQRHISTLHAEHLDIQRHVYFNRIKNLIGIFGALLISNLVSWLPFIATSFFVLVSGNNIPDQAYAITLVLFLSNNASNPVIQIYFRRDLLDAMKAIFLRKSWCMKGRENLSLASHSNNEAEKNKEGAAGQTFGNCGKSEDKGIILATEINCSPDCTLDKGSQKPVVKKEELDKDVVIENVDDVASSSPVPSVAST